MKKWIFLALLMSSLSAHALVFIEPMIGYSTGKLESTTNSDPAFKFDMKGLGYGARAGVSLMGLQLGVDYLQNSYKVTNSTYNYNEKLKLTETSVFVGYRLLFFRLYGAYMLDSKSDDDDDDAKLESGLKVGGTFYAFSNVALSLEMRQAKFKEYTDSDGDKINTKYNTLALLVSFPFEI